jgi:hypothetical protein
MFLSLFLVLTVHFGQDSKIEQKPGFHISPSYFCKNMENL